MRWPHFKALVLFLIHKVWALFAWSTLPFNFKKEENEAEEDISRVEDTIIHLMDCMCGMVHHYNHKWSRRSKVISSWRNALRPVITFRYARNISRAIWAKKIEHAQSVSYKSWGEIPKIGQIIKSVYINSSTNMVSSNMNLFKKMGQLIWFWLKSSPVGVGMTHDC